MRILARLSVGLVLLLLTTAALGFGGYSLLLRWHREPEATRPLKPMGAIAPIESPRQVPFTDFAHPSMAGLLVSSNPAGQGSYPIRVRLRAPTAATPDAGIAVIESDGSVHWQPLSVGARDGDDFLFEVSCHHPGTRNRCDAAFAPNRAAATHGYFTHTSHRGPAPAVELQLDGKSHATVLRLPAGLDRTGPVRLSRTDDAAWVPMTPSGAALTLTQSQPLDLRLGAGEYEVSCPLAPDLRQVFRVPSDAPITLQCAPEGPRAGRP